MEEEQVDILLSALEHYIYCPRQCGLIHVEATYRENVYTLRGNHAHERVDSGIESKEGDVRSKRNVPLWSERLGLRGKADLVEFHASGPYPVEYKVGKRRSYAAEVQLCAQALCLEEMLRQEVAVGAIYYVGARRRHEVHIDHQLRKQTIAAIHSIRHMVEAQEMPLPVNDRRCRRCSLYAVCMPQVIGEPDRLRGLQGALYSIYDVA